MRKALIVAVAVASLGGNAFAGKLSNLPFKVGIGSGIATGLKSYDFTFSPYEEHLTRPAGIYSYGFVESKPLPVKGFGVALRAEYGKEYVSTDETVVDTTTHDSYEGKVFEKESIWTIGIKVMKNRFGVELARGKARFVNVYPVWGTTETGSTNVSSVAFSYDITKHLAAKVRYYNENFNDFVKNFRDGAVHLCFEYTF